MSGPLPGYPWNTTTAAYGHEEAWMYIGIGTLILIIILILLLT